MIEVHSLTRRYGTTTALADVSFHIASGEIVGFLGPNGAGKTTAMKILTCTLAPSAGRATVAGFDTVTEAIAVRQQVGFMPEHVPLYQDASVHELLRFVAALKGVPASRSESELAEIEARTGLDDVKGKLVGHLSKGYRQRVGFAQALIGDPPILILDEPTAGLDPHQIVEVRELIRAYQGQKTVLLSSHILNEVSLVCERVLILDQGRLVAEESPAVLARMFEARQSVIMAWDGPQESIRQALSELDGVSEVVTTPQGASIILSDDPQLMRPRLAAAVIAAGGSLQQLQDHSPSLEDLFLRVTTGSHREEPS